MDGDEPEQDVRQDVGPDTPQQEDDVPPVMAGVGMHAGKSSGGQAGRRIVEFESSGATLDLEAMGGEPKALNVSVTGTRVGPAGSYPKRYHEVIDSWLKRRGR